MKKRICILMTVLMLASLCGTAFAEGISDGAKKTVHHADPVFYENGGVRLPVARQYDALVTVDTPENDEYGELFSVSETASIEAALATDQYFDGVGWLFSISRVDEDQLRQMLCYFMFGSDVFGKDEEGMYYIFNHPTDVRIVRESYDDMDDDMEIWSELNQWAWQVKENFLDANPGIQAETRGNSDPEIYLARTAWMKDEVYTLSTTEGGPREPEDVDPVPYVERLTTNVLIDLTDDAEAPDGEYVVLTLPDERVRVDFFLAEGKENIIRTVTDDGQETLWQAEYKDGKTKASEIMQEWYDALKAES